MTCPSREHNPRRSATPGCCLVAVPFNCCRGRLPSVRTPRRRRGAPGRHTVRPRQTLPRGARCGQATHRKARRVHRILESSVRQQLVGQRHRVLSVRCAEVGHRGAGRALADLQRRRASAGGGGVGVGSVVGGGAEVCDGHAGCGLARLRGGPIGKARRRAGKAWRSTAAPIQRGLPAKAAGRRTRCPEHPLPCGCCRSMAS